MDILSAVPDTGDARFDETLGRLRIRAAQANDTLAALQHHFRAMARLVSDFESARHQAFADWLTEQGRAWCGMCEKTHDTLHSRVSLIEIYAMSPEKKRDGLAFAEIINACLECQRNWEKDKALPRCRYSTDMHSTRSEYDLADAMRLNDTWHARRDIWKTDPDYEGPPIYARKVYAGTVFRPVPHAKEMLLPKTVSDACAREAGLPEAVRLFPPSDTIPLYQGSRCTYLSGTTKFEYSAFPAEHT